MTERESRYFAFQLSRELGIADPDRLLRGISSRKLSEWRAFLDLEAEREREAAMEAKAAARIEHPVRHRRR